MPDDEVGWFLGRFRLLADAGLGLASYRGDADLEIRSAGGKGVFVDLPLEPFDAYRLRLQLTMWQGSAILLYAVPAGCDIRPGPVQVSLVYCRALSGVGGSDLRDTVLLLADMYSWLVLALWAANVGACFLRLDRALRELAAQGRLGREAAVVLSPYLFSWDLQLNALTLKAATDLFSSHPPGTLSVVGLPVAGPDGRWAWPLRRIRRQYWKLLYSEYPTGSARRLVSGPDSTMCHGGDAVSGSRIYRPELLSKLLAHVDPVENAAWLVNLDLEALRWGANGRTFLCGHGVFAEEDYLQHADLTSELGARYEVEAALFHPAVGVRVNCPITVRHTSETIFDIVNRRGLVVPWCFRHALRDAFRALAGWWHALSPSHFVVASDGTGLSLLRNSREPIPWDVDVDVQLYAEGPEPFNFVAFAEWTPEVVDRRPVHEALARLRELGFSWTSVKDYSARGAAWHVEFTYTDATARPSPVTVDLDVVLKSYAELSWFPLTADFAGVTVRMGQDFQLNLMKKYGPARKLLRNEDDIACQDPGHNACLPNCTLYPCTEACDLPQVVDCEFPDRFVELDFFA